MKEILLADLISEAGTVIQTFGYATSTLVFYNRHWRNLKNYFDRNRIKMFSVQMSDQFLKVYEKRMKAGKISASNYRSVKRAIHFLQDYYVNETTSWKRIEKKVEEINNANFLQIANGFSCFLRDMQKSSGTIGVYTRIVKEFLTHISFELGRTYITEIIPEDIHSYIAKVSFRYPKGLHVVLPALRSFFNYLVWKQMVEEKLVMAIPQSSKRVTPLRSAISRDEMDTIIQSIKLDGISPKRDYAIILLASKTGLRRSDIAGLKLQDIHWREHTMSLTQQKTSIPLIIPMLAEVGNALAEYILYERPESDSPFIFLRTCAPYQKIDGGACYEIIRKAMDKNGIHQNPGESRGMHCIRHSLAQQLLECGVPLPVISSVLGHQNRNSTKAYLAVDFRNLSFCALSLNGIEVVKEELL